MTPDQPLPKTLVQSLAERLEHDIHRKNLRPGDRYMTAAEASEWLSASPVTVNRAMQILSEKDILVRRRSRGTFVGPGFRRHTPDESQLDVVHAMIALDYHQSRATASDVLVDAIRASLPNIGVDLHFIPEADLARSTRRIVERLHASELTEGVILIRGSRESQCLLQESQIPTVVFGQVYPQVKLNCVRHDQKSIGRLMAEYALENHHQRMALFTHSRWLHGDNLMVSGLTKHLSQAGIALDDLRIRSLAADPEVIHSAVHECLWDEAPPTIIMCRSDNLAEHVLHEWTQLCQQSPALPKPQVISGGHGQAGPAAFVRVVSDWSTEKQIGGLVHLLEQLVESPDTCEQVTIPVHRA